MYHDSGELFRTLSAWVDVSARRRTEEALGLSEARFRSLAEAGPFMVYSSDAEGLPSYLSPSLVAYLGLTVEQVRDEDVLRSIVHPEDFGHVAVLRAPVARDGDGRASPPAGRRRVPLVPGADRRAPR